VVGVQGSRWFRVSLALNVVAMIVGVLVTLIVNCVLFTRNDQQLDEGSVFWAAFGQPLLSFFILAIASGLEYKLTPPEEPAASEDAQMMTA
jgi:hypothetical protein